MTGLNFGDEVTQLQETGINLAKQAPDPDFMGARIALDGAEAMVIANESPLKAAIFTGRTKNDLGVVGVREGLYLRSEEAISDEEALDYVSDGIEEIQVSYASLVNLLTDRGPELRQQKLVAAMNAHICGTMNTWFRAAQTEQLLAGKIGPTLKADAAVTDAQWMLGRGKPSGSGRRLGKTTEPGAWVYGKRGDNGYWSVQTALLGMRGERINGGPVHLLKGLKWGAFRGLPEFGRRLVTDHDNRKQIVLTSGRLSLESLTRKRAIAAALDYQRF